MSSDPSARPGTGSPQEDEFRSKTDVSTFRSDPQETAGLLVGLDHYMEVDNSAASSSSFGKLSHPIRPSNLVPVGPQRKDVFDNRFLGRHEDRTHVRTEVGRYNAPGPDPIYPTAFNNPHEHIYQASRNSNLVHVGPPGGVVHDNQSQGMSHSDITHVRTELPLPHATDRSSNSAQSHPSSSTLDPLEKVHQEVIFLDQHDTSLPTFTHDHTGGHESLLSTNDDDIRSIANFDDGDTVDGALNELSPTNDKKRSASHVDDVAQTFTAPLHTKKRKQTRKKGANLHEPKFSPKCLLVMLLCKRFQLRSTSSSDMSSSSSSELLDNLFINYSNNNIDEMKRQFADMSWYGHKGLAKFVCRLKPDDLCKYYHYLVSLFKLIDLLFMTRCFLYLCSN